MCAWVISDFIEKVLVSSTLQLIGSLEKKLCIILSFVIVTHVKLLVKPKYE